MKNYKIYISIVLMCAFFTILPANTLNIAGEYNTGILNHPMNLTNSIVLRRIPVEMYKPNRNFRISWTPTTLVNAKLYFSSSPKGAINVLENYIQAPANIQSQVIEIDGMTVRTILTNANSLGISTGNYYCVIHDETTQSTSMEFELIIISENGVNTISPASGSIVSNNQTPTFSWQSQAGVPYYHIILSDQPFTLSYDDDNKLVVNGLNVIWQIVTPSTSAQYGIPDPSGSITNQNPPPLINGKEYNWIVLANFGNDPLYSSDVTGNPSGFVYQSSVVLSNPSLTSPLNNSTINDETILFVWDTVPNAIAYHIYLSEKRLEAGSVVFYPVWDQFTTNNMIEFNASEVLIHSPYVWKVLAFDENNNSSSSTNFNFNYEIPVGTLNITVLDNNGNGIAFANVNAVPVEGSMDNVPFTVNSQGREKKKLPLGQYNISINKNGYESQTFNITITEDPNHFNEDITTFHTFLTATLAFSPAFFTGSVKVGEQNVQNVTIKATSSSGQIRTQTSSSGNYSIAVTPGAWTLTAERQGYTLVTPINSSINSGQSVNISNPGLQMTVNTKNISGVVQLPSGAVLSQVTVTLQKDNTTITRITNNTGAYQFSGVSLGTWTMTWQRTGYTPPQPQTLTITTTTPTNTTMPVATMTPRANVVSGNATDGTVGISNVQITATPLSGSAFQTTTNVYGQYTINLPQGNYIITANHPQYSAQNNQQVNLTVGQTINNLNITMTANQSFITGTVLSGGDALSNVTITAGSFTTQTNTSGNYTLPVAAGTYNIIASRNGFITTNQNNVSVGLAQTVNNINFSMSANPAVISGTVLLNGTGVSNASITGYRLSGSTQIAINPILTNNSGEYTLSVSAGTYYLTAQKTGLVSNTITVTVTSGSHVTNQNITTQVNQATITGTVNNDQGGVVRNASIFVQEINNATNTYSTVTNIYGNFQINVTAGRRYRITASRTGFSSSIITMANNIAIGSTQNHDFVLIGQNSSIAGRITDQNNNNITSALITAQKSGETYSVNSGATGNYSLSLAYGTWQISISKPGYTTKDTTMVLAAGENITNKRFRLNTNFASLNGVVIGSVLQTPLANVAVTATNSLGGGGTVSTNQNGQYSFINLIPGNYNITYTRNNYLTNSVNNLVLSGNTITTRNISLVPLSGSINFICNQNNTTLTIENTVSGVITNYTLNSGSTLIQGLVTNIPLNISASKSGYIDYQSENNITIPPNQTLETEITLVQATGQISGIVSNQTGDGLSNAQVQITSTGGFSRITTTSASGSYVFNNIPAEITYTISATHAGYYVADEDVFLSSTSLIKNIEMQMMIMSISGTVKNQFGNTLANIPVRAVSGSSVANTNTNSEGNFTLTGLQPYRTYSVSTVSNAPGYENTSQAVVILGSNVTLPADSPLTMQVHISSISGIVTDSLTTAPISGATVIAYNNNSQITHTITTQSNGFFTLNNLYDGVFRITVVRSNYRTKVVQNISLGYNESSTQNIQLTYIAPVIVSGSVKKGIYPDLDNQEVYANVPVRLIAAGMMFSDTTDENGNFTFSGVPPYTNNVTISTVLTPSNQYDNAIQTINTTSQNISQLQLVISVKNAIVSGTVTDQNNQPLGLARVRLRRVSDSIDQIFMTTSNGQFSFINQYEGNYQLRVTRGSYLPSNELNITLSDGDNHVQNIQLEQIIGQIAGIITNNYDNPVINCKISLFNTENNTLIEEVQSNQDGSFIFETVSEGVYHLRISKTGYQTIQNLQVNHNSSNLEITLDAIANAIIGTVYYQENPYTSTNQLAVIKALNSQNQLRQTIADEFGDYAITDITGFQRLWAETPIYTSYWQEVNISSGQTTFADIQLIESRRIPGRVTYEDNGISGVSIIATNINSGRVFNTSTNNQGIFSLTGLPAASYLVQGYLQGYVFNEDFPTIQLTSTQDADSLHFTVSFTGNSISGSAISSVTGNGINNVTIELWGNQRRFNQGRNISISSKNTEESTLLATTQTNSSGAFTFTNIIDGDYVLKAHRAGYAEVDDLNVSVIGGEMTPSTVQFIMSPIEGVIYGLVNDSESNPLPITQVTITNQNDDSISETVSTNNQGYYSYTVPTNGSYFVQAEREYYYPATPQLVLINTNFPEYTSAEANFQLTLKPATLLGSVIINDLTDNDNPVITQPDSLIMTLYVPEQNPITVIFPDSTYSFENIYLPLNQYIIQLYIRAVYNDVIFKELIPVSLTPGDETIYNRAYDYIPGSKSISGYVRMEHSDDNIVPISDANIYLIRQDTIINTTTTNSNGYYQFNSLLEGSYKVKISARYNFELFEETSDFLPWPNDDSDIVFNHTFDYILSKIKITLKDNLGNPVQGNNVVINSELLNQPITLITNQNGVVETQPILHSGDYSIRVVPQIINNQTWIYPRSFIVEFNEISNFEKEINLPLKFDLSSISSTASTDSILISLTKSSTYQNNVFFHYTDTFNQNHEVLMAVASNNTLQSYIPAQNRSGIVSFYFRSVDSENQLIYSNQNNPYDLTITAEGIISQANSLINPQTATLSYKISYPFEINLSDELDNDLDEIIDSNPEALVTWTLQDTTIGYLEHVEGAKRKIIYHTPSEPMGIITNFLNVRVRIGEYTITLQSEITIRDLKLKQINITDDDNDFRFKVDNSKEFKFFRVTALSESNIPMTIPINIPSIASYEGNLIQRTNGVRYYPQNNFIGRIKLKANAFDPIYENEVRAVQNIDVYKNIVGGNQVDSLFTDNNCSLILPANMLRDGTAQIYLYRVTVSPSQGVGIESEVVSDVYNTEVSGSSNFLRMPTIIFNTDNEKDLNVAWWDIYRLDWIRLDSGTKSEVLSAEMPGWYQYCLLRESLKLGLYDLKLLPNPFTPHDVIGANKGLQISFKVSSNKTRYPKVTCKVYNLHGTLVRTIADNQPLLKGLYDIGGENSLYWDGYTNDNRMARNGRYIIHLIVEDSKDRKEFVKPVVLVK